MQLLLQSRPLAQARHGLCGAPSLVMLYQMLRQLRPQVDVLQQHVVYHSIKGLDEVIMLIIRPSFGFPPCVCVNYHQAAPSCSKIGRCYFTSRLSPIAGVGSFLLNVACADPLADRTCTTIDGPCLDSICALDV
jgi:hypothetical protein